MLRAKIPEQVLAPPKVLTTGTRGHRRDERRVDNLAHRHQGGAPPYRTTGDGLEGWEGRAQSGRRLPKDIDLIIVGTQPLNDLSVNRLLRAIHARRQTRRTRI